jgi:hypothetical protein
MPMICCTDAAMLLRWTYWRTRDALLSGKLRGRRAADGRYLIELESVNEVLAARKAETSDAAPPPLAT